MIFPPPLPAGATVGLVSPASPLPAGSLDKAAARLESLGFRVRLSPGIYAQERFLAGDDRLRAAELNAFFEDDSIDAVFASRGGYGTQRILDRIDYALIRRKPKPFVGLSDTTALQNALLARCGLVSYSGFLPYSDAGTGQIPPVTEMSLLAALNHEDQSFAGETLCPGEASGPLIGGCLTLVSGLLGTPCFPDPEGAVLVLEDVGEDPYRIDRMLAHLELAGVFRQAAAVVFGEFYKCVSKDPADGTIDDVLNEWGRRIGKPVLRNIPYGHQPNHVVLPLGGRAAVKNGTLYISGKA